MAVDADGLTPCFSHCPKAPNKGKNLYSDLPDVNALDSADAKQSEDFFLW